MQFVEEPIPEEEVKAKDGTASSEKSEHAEDGSEADTLRAQSGDLSSSDGASSSHGKEGEEAPFSHDDGALTADEASSSSSTSQERQQPVRL